MQQLVQNLKILRAMPGRFLPAAIVVAAALAFNSRVQAGPIQGAIVTHIDRDRTGGYYAESADGQLRLDVVLSGQGDFLSSQSGRDVDPADRRTADAYDSQRSRKRRGLGADVGRQRVSS